MKKLIIKKVRKPWGEERWIARSPHYLGKLLFIKKGRRLSRQFHRHKHETIYCSRGTCVIELRGKPCTLRPGESIALPPKIVHRICAPYGLVVLFEVSSFHPRDVVRLEDDYGR